MLLLFCLLPLVLSEKYMIQTLEFEGCTYVYILDKCVKHMDNKEKYVKLKKKDSQNALNCVYDDSNCSQNENCTDYPLSNEYGSYKYSDKIPNHLFHYRMGYDDKCSDLNEAYVILYDSKCYLADDDEQPIYRQFSIENNKLYNKFYTDSKCTNVYDGEDPDIKDCNSCDSVMKTVCSQFNGSSSFFILFILILLLLF